ncbi:unnamed protein product [Meganyctiphanes norvegica]|uniref:C2H2-type domain-containing protein n=1 Tax=Meganyctiphanes norvegica TaxID=48144 RepID=A0AAV2R6Z0_MEGNR
MLSTNHVRTHMGERPYQCTRWNETFFNKTYFYQYLRTHTEKQPYQCSHCDKAFSQMKYYKPFENTHQGETMSINSAIIKGIFTQMYFEKTFENTQLVEI